MLRKRALALAAVLSIGLIPTLPSYAVTTYASPADLIEDVVEVALEGATSPTMESALTEMKGKVTLTGDEVFYDGTSIGYWYSEESSTIYTTEAQADTVVVSDGSNGWEVEPLIFEDILSDVNEDLIENVVPTTADWSKIIGKYDVNLGGITFPADQWVPLTPSEDPLDEGKTFNVSTAIGATNSEIHSVNRITLCSYLIDNDGNLYIQDLYISYSRNGSGYIEVHRGGISSDESAASIVNSTDFAISDTSATIYPYSKVGLYNYSGNDLEPILYITNISNTQVGSVGHNSASFLSVKDASQVWDNTSGYKEVGVFYIDQETVFGNSRRAESFRPYLTNMFTQTPASSKKVTGNTTLTKRLAKLSNLAASDTIVFTASGWTVNGLEDLDSYISTSILTEAGQSATMDGTVEIEELNFKVVVPSTLPMVADSEGNVQVASNASIDNKSNAKVKITGLEIEANAESGWTMVDSNPSKTRGDNEFSFGTSLSIGDVIAKGDELEFTYNADLSPAEQGVDSVDLVTLTITLDWAE